MSAGATNEEATPSGDREGRIVVVGGGFGGLACARALGKRGTPTTLIDQHNYHLFIPLLYQVATAGLSPADVAQPIRRILRRYESVRVINARATGVDTERREVLLENGRHVPYRALVLATGAQYNYFGHDDWAAYAPGLRTINNARTLRANLLAAFEQAEMEDAAAAREALLTTVIVGGGPTGVEMAGAVVELCRFALARDFRSIDPRSAQVILIEAAPRLLTAFQQRLSDYAYRRLQSMGVTVRLSCTVQTLDRQGVIAGGERIRAGNVIWTAGVKASDAVSWLGGTSRPDGRIEVRADLSVVERENIYAIGDTADCVDAEGHALPALAQVASQQGTHLGKALDAWAQDGTAVPAFRFRNRGNTAIIGRNAAVFEFGRWCFTGRMAWLLWGIVHIYLLVGFEQRVLVATQWLWHYLTYERGARLIERG